MKLVGQTKYRQFDYNYSLFEIYQLAKEKGLIKKLKNERNRKGV
jgi:hypothetical protein